MAIACKCDRCGKFFKGLENGRVKKKIKIGSFPIVPDCRGPIDDEEMDLCNSCFEALDNWLHGKIVKPLSKEVKADE